MYSHVKSVPFSHNKFEKLIKRQNSFTTEIKHKETKAIREPVAAGQDQPRFYPGKEASLFSWPFSIY